MLPYKYIQENQVAQVDKAEIEPHLNPDLVKIISAMKHWGFEVRIVGGAVRDILTHKAPRDIDLVTNALPDETSYILSTIGMDVDGFGVKHGTVKAVVGDEKYEITSLAYTITNHNGRLVIDNGGDWFQDSIRRDFTMNALYMDLDGKVYDYIGGLEDIQNGVLKPIPDFDAKIKNDPAIVLRFFKFLSKFPGIKFSKGTLNTVKDNIGLIKNLEPDRLAKEISNVYAGEDSKRVLKMMNKLGIDTDMDGANED